MAIGDIGSIIDTLQFDTTCGEPKVIHIAGDIFAVVYSGPDTDGFLKTFDVDEDGNIGAVVDTLEFDTGDGVGPVIIRRQGTMYIIAYRGADGDGFAKTVSITDAGVIGSVVDTLEFDTSNCWLRRKSLLQVAGDIIAVAYQGPSNNLLVKTFDVSVAGAIGSVIDTLTITVGQVLGIDFVNIVGDLYAVLFQSAAEDTRIKTFTIDTSGNIGTVIATKTLDTTDGEFNDPVLFNISGAIYAAAYSSSTSKGKITTLNINSDGTFGSVIDNKDVLATAWVALRSFLLVSGKVYSLIYTNGNDDGWIITITIDIDGTIGSIVDTFEFDADAAYVCDLAYRGGTTYIIGYEAASDVGKIISLDIGSPSHYPTDEITRVTGITHIHDRRQKPTVYREVLQLGGLANLPSLEAAYQDIVNDPSPATRDRYFREPWLDPREKILPKMEPRVDLPKPVPQKGMPWVPPPVLPQPKAPQPKVPGGRKGRPSPYRGGGRTIIKKGGGFPSGGSGGRLRGGF